MSTLDVFRALDAAGVRLFLVDGKLKFEAAAGGYTDELKALVREHRAGIMAHLEREARLYETTPTDLDPRQHYRSIPCDPQRGLVGTLGVAATGELLGLVLEWEQAVRAKAPEAWVSASRYWGAWCRIAPGEREVAA